MTENPNEEEFNEHKEFNPLAKPTIKRDYTTDMIQAGLGDIPAEELNQPIPEATYSKPIIEEDNASSKKSKDDLSYSDDDKQPINPPLEDLTNTQKRKAAVKTADSMLAAYGRFLPVPFLAISSFNMPKMENLDLKGDLDLNMVIRDSGYTVRNHMDGVNQQTQEIFVVTEEMKEELKDPLVDLLMEQSLALTPAQRLMVAVGGHIAQMGMATYQFARANSSALEQFKEFKKEDNAKGLYSSNRPTQQAQPYQQQPQQQQQPAPSMVVVQDEQVQEPMYTPPTDTETTEEPTYDKPNFDLDDYLNGDKKTGTTE